MIAGTYDFVKGLIVGTFNLVHGAGVQYYDLREDPEGTLRNWARFAMDVAPLANPGIPEKQDDKILVASMEKDVEDNLINGDTYTRTRFVTDAALNVATFYDGVGEASVAGKVGEEASIERVANIVDKTSETEKVSNVDWRVGNPVKQLLGGSEWNNYFKNDYGANNVEWTSKEVISNSERLKLSQWKWAPKDELYLKYKDVYNNDLYYNQSNGNINWPSNYGFLEEVPNEVTVNPSMILDRYGEPTGQFMANATDSYESRALAPHSETAKHYYYKPTEEFTMDAGTAAPWFGSNGGATQYLKYHSNGELYTVQELIHDGLLDDITDLVEKGLINVEK
jgi:predicted ribonuclease toxin of YeeF-YezG toxin-antitoxin module